jgi:hypothetical protein
VLVLLFIGPFGAGPQAEKIHPGIMCVQGEPLSNFENGTYVGRVTNNTVTRLEISYSVMRAHTERSWNFETAHVQDSNRDLNPSCEAFEFQQQRGLTPSPITRFPPKRASLD